MKHLFMIAALLVVIPVAVSAQEKKVSGEIVIEGGIVTHSDGVPREEEFLISAELVRKLNKRFGLGGILGYEKTIPRILDRGFLAGGFAFSNEKDTASIFFFGGVTTEVRPMTGAHLRLKCGEEELSYIVRFTLGHKNHEETEHRVRGYDFQQNLSLPIKYGFSFEASSLAVNGEPHFGQIGIGIPIWRSREGSAKFFAIPEVIVPDKKFGFRMAFVKRF